MKNGKLKLNSIPSKKKLNSIVHYTIKEWKVKEEEVAWGRKIYSR